MQIKAFFQLISKAAPVWPRADSIGRILPPSFLFQSVSRWSGCGVNFTSFQFQSIEICQDVWGLCGLIARLELINQEYCSTSLSLSLCTGSQTMLWQWSQNESVVTLIAVRPVQWYSCTVVTKWVTVRPVHHSPDQSSVPLSSINSPFFQITTNSCTSGASEIDPIQSRVSQLSSVAVPYKTIHTN